MSCTCFLRYQMHEFVPDPFTKPGEIVLRCIHCDAPMAEAMASERDYEIAVAEGRAVPYLERLKAEAMAAPKMLLWGQPYLGPGSR